MKAIIISAYIGPLPNWFSLWARSAGANPQVHFMVVSDQPVPPGLPDNVSFRHATLADLQRHWSDHCGLEVALTTPYKLNDYKPLFWTLVPEIGSRYDYWGFCDLDVMFGDLTPIVDNLCGRYDMILSEGHLRFLRTGPVAQQAWQDITTPRTWRDILTDPVIFGMDEHQGINRVFASGPRSWFADPALIADIHPSFRQFRRLPYLRNDRVQAFFWEDGHVYREFWHGGKYGREELLYIHIQKRRMAVDPALATSSAIDIGPQGFTPRDSRQTARADLLRRNPPHFPNGAEGRVLLRELVRRLTGKDPPFPAVRREGGGQPAA